MREHENHRSNRTHKKQDSDIRFPSMLAGTLGISRERTIEGLTGSRTTSQIPRMLILPQTLV